MPKKEKKPYAGVIPGGERFSYYLGGFGQGMMYGIMSAFILDFYLNVARLNVVFVLLLSLLSRVWDAVNDPIMGVLIDRANPKRGKLRSYLFYLPLPIALLTILMFWVPDLGPNALMVYAAATYVLWEMLYTAADIPYWGLPNAMTPHEGERAVLVSISRISNGVGSALPQAMIIVLSMVLGQLLKDDTRADNMKFMATAIVCAALGLVCYMQTPFKVKERVPLPVGQEPGGKNKGAFRRVLGCRPLMMTVLMGILSGGRYMYQAAAPHVARYALYYGDFKAMMGMDDAGRSEAMQVSYGKVFGIMQAALAVGMFVTMVVTPLLYKRFSYKQLLIGSCLVGGAASLATWFIGYGNVYAFAPLLLLSAVPVGVINVVAFPMAGDSLDYMEWKTGRRENALGAACLSFVSKLANGLATTSITLVYLALKLDVNEIVTTAGANLASITPDRIPDVRGGFFSLVSLVPAISLLVCIVPVLFYDLTGERKARVMKELAERREREASEA